MDNQAKHFLYRDKYCIMATMHCKEQIIAPVFLDLLGMKIIKACVDTDQLGTFSGEIERKGTALECALSKCELALKSGPHRLSVASEGSFGPHPFFPFEACDHEILYFVDKELDFKLHLSLISSKTNYKQQVIEDIDQLRAFCKKALFPSHALIVKVNKPYKENLIIKDIHDFDSLQVAFSRCCDLSEDRNALLETDMRAHKNPTRMALIKELSISLAERLSTLCPSCRTPGWGVVDIIKGLECQYCEAETDLIKYRVLGCTKCEYRDTLPREDGLLFAQPDYCNWCNS